MDFSERLKKLRKETGLTQKELSENLNVAQPRILEWEKGKRNPNKKSLEKIASFFNVSVSYLLGETNIRSTSRINEILEQLPELRQQKIIIYAENQLKEYLSEKNIINLQESLIPYEVEEEHSLSAGNGEGYTTSQNKITVYWDQKVPYDRAIWIKGDSMEPDFHHGEVALIKYQNSLDFPGQICAVDDVERGQAYIKSVKIVDDYLVLHSLNNSVDDSGNLIFLDKYIPLSDNPRIIGKVVDHFIPIEK